MGQEGLNASAAEMCLVEKSTVDRLIAICREVFVKANKFMKHEENRKNKEGLNKLLTELDHSEVRINTFYLLNLITNDEKEQYRAESDECFKKTMEFCYGKKQADEEK